MPHPLRLRQICLAAPRLSPVIDDLQSIFGLAVCHRDPALAVYGLENALLPLGSDFLEVVAPLHEGTAAGRFIARSRGHGGYMAIFQADDPRRRQAHAAMRGVRTAHEIDRPAYQSVQLHPRDCRAAFIEFGHSPGGDDRQGAWWPAGAHWQDSPAADPALRLLGIELESPQPAALAAHWSALLEQPLAHQGGAPGLRLDGRTLRFVPGRSDCLGAVVLQVADAAATLERAVARGLWVEQDAFHLAGVHLRVRSAPQGAGVVSPG
jgi:hypothetical protein